MPARSSVRYRHLLMLLVLLPLFSTTTARHSPAAPLPHLNWLPLLLNALPEELAIVDPARAADWQPVVGQGVALRVPPGWNIVEPVDFIRGYDFTTIAAPACATTSSLGCQHSTDEPHAMIRIRVHRGVPPSGSLMNVGEQLVAAGFQARSVSVQGRTAILYQQDSGGDTALILYQDDVEYLLWMSAGVTYTPETQLFGLVLGTLALTPAEAPPVADSSDQAFEQASATPANYVPNMAVAYAIPYANQATNSDGCYVYTDPGNNVVRCGRLPLINITTERDGAHFVDCALKAGGWKSARCNGIKDQFIDPAANSIYLDFASLRDQLIADKAQPITSGIRPGDILILHNDQDEYCQGGIVVQGGAQIVIAKHSYDGFYDLNAVGCGDGVPVTQEIFRLDDTPPIITWIWPTTPTVTIPAYQPQTLRWQGTDDQSIASYILERAVTDGPPVATDFTTVLTNTLTTSYAIHASTPCRTQTYRITAVDGVGNTQSATRTLKVNLLGDIDSNGVISDTDVAAVEAAWGIRTGQPGWNPLFDVVPDGQIDAADVIWMRRHVGDTCQ